MDAKRLESQLAFIREIDKIKGIARQSLLFDGSRFENDAEHSWTVCVMALVLAEYSNEKVDLGRVIQMLLVHDVVEVDSGDTFLYAPERDSAAVADREERAARRIFGILGEDQGRPLLETWLEFEARETAEARFAAVLDRLEPLLQNYANSGFTWKKHGIRSSQVVERNAHIAEGSAELWDYARGLIEESVKRGYLAE
jgi:putative hydrolases of HD superfamily